MAKQLLKNEFLNKTLLLFDGLDEISHRWTREDDTLKFIESIICDAPNVIVTSRPQANIFDVGKFDLELETIGFTSNQINAYLENCIRDRNSISRIQALISKKPLVQGLLRIPIQLDAFCCTWSSRIPSSTTETDGIHPESSGGLDEDDVSTMSALYQSITNELYRKDLDRLDRATQSRRLAEVKVNTCLQEELFFLGDYAFQGMMSSIINFTPYHRNIIDSFLFETRNQASDFDSFVLERLSYLCTSGVEQDPSKRNYHFIHLTFQEFFAARHFVHHWRSNTNLIYLDINSQGVEDETISPAKFLQTQKYNPQFNIFWRFVTGLVQEKGTSRYELPAKNKNVLTLFGELNDEPIDLLGPAHRRLLMYCLSEVLPSKNQQIQELRKREESFIAQWTLRELDATDSIILGREAECPEGVLCILLQTANDLQQTTSDIQQDANEIQQTADGLCRAILSALEDRPFVSIQTLRCVSKYTNYQKSMEIRLRYIRVVFKNSRSDSQEIVAQAAQLFSTTLKDRQWNVRLSAVKSLECQFLLPRQASIALITALVDEDSRVRYGAANTLAGQPYSYIEPVTTLITALKDEEISCMRRLAAHEVEEHLSPSAELIDMVRTSIQHRRPSTPRSVATIEERPLPAEAVTTLITSLQENGHSVAQCSAINALAGRSSLPTEAITALITALKIGEPHVRWAAAGALYSLLSPPAEVIAALIIALGDDHFSVRDCAAHALEKQSSMSVESIIALIAMLDDRNSLAADILHKHSLFYSAIKNFSSKSRRLLWSYWIGRSFVSDVCCYEVEGCLYVWSNGTLHQTSTDPLRTQALLQVVLPARIQPTPAIAAPASSQARQSPSILQTPNANGVAGATSKSRRHWFGFKKRK